MPMALSAQGVETEPSFFATLGISDFVLVLGLVILLGALYAMLRALSLIAKLEEIRMLKEKGMDEVAARYEVPDQSIFKQIWRLLEGRKVSLTEEKDILLDHNYDGIQELDNNLPPWWLGMFYASIIFAPIYIYIYHYSDFGPSSAEAYEIEMQTAEEDVATYLATQADQIDETNAVLMTEEADISAGLEIYSTQCVVCHGQLGEGGVGPNFTDEYWIHGGDIKDLFKTIKYGVPEKGMISWTGQLRPSEMQQVASFILTFQGTDPPNQKDPEGELWKASAAPARVDSTAVPADSSTTGE
jgi:cytochrome c oxidase cbb3-type subunit 3